MLLISLGFLLFMLPVWMHMAGQPFYKPLGRLPAIAATLAITLASAYAQSLSMAETSALLVFIVQTVWIFLFIRTGHGVAFYMGYPNPVTRRQFLSPLVDKIAWIFNIPFQTRTWCQVFMGCKGLAIGLGMLPAGILLAVLWPMAYQYSRDLKHTGKQILGLNGAPLAEWLVGFCLLAVSLLNIWYIRYFM